MAIAGVGTIGTQVLIYGLGIRLLPDKGPRAAGVAWCAGFGRLGGIVGPVVGGILVGAGVGGTVAFVIFAVLALCGAAVIGVGPAQPTVAICDERPWGGETRHYDVTVLIGPTGCVGRDLELSELAERLHRTVSDGAGVVAVVGGPGIGKTALLRALADQHGNALWARATPWETDLPGGVLAQLLQDEVPDDPVDAAAHLVDRLRALRTGAADHR